MFTGRSLRFLLNHIIIIISFWQVSKTLVLSINFFFLMDLRLVAPRVASLDLNLICILKTSYFWSHIFFFFWLFLNILKRSKHTCIERSWHPRREPSAYRIRYDYVTRYPWRVSFCCQQSVSAAITSLSQVP